MRRTIKVLAMLFGALVLQNIADAESPREQFKQMVEQLQKNSTDNVLREKIIKLAQTIKPAPAVPEEAIRYEGRAQYVFTHAKNEQDYTDAAKEYERAVTAAPWVVGYYSDLCTIYEKAGKLSEAKHNCDFYLSGTSDPSLVADVKRRIAGLEIGIERSSPEAIAARKIEESKKRGLVGFWQLQSARSTLNPRNPNIVDGVWKNTDPQYRYAYEISKTGDSYEITPLIAPQTRYKTLRADATAIEFGRTDCVEGEGRPVCDYSHQCAISGEQLFCSVRYWNNDVVRGDSLREEERWVRRESCVTEPEDQKGMISVRCR